MPRKKTTNINVRLTAGERKVLNHIMAGACLPDESSAVRFCISFTKMMLSAVPAYSGEACLEVDEILKDSID
jgi:hypothetical protein